MAAASASSVQSIFATGRATRAAGNQTRRNQISSFSLPRQQRNVNSMMSIRCMAEEPKSSSSSSSSSSTDLPKPVTNINSSINTPPSSVTPATAKTTPSPPPPPRAPKMSTKINDLLAFSGPAPERINGRLAMIGFVAAIGAELAKGDDVVAQLANGGLPWFIGTSVILTLASLIPLSKGVSVESKSSGVMSSSAEMWNGRFAMLGLVALVFTEFVTGGALV